MNEKRITGNQNGVVLLCDLQGMIVQVLRNDLPCFEAAPGHLFPRLVDPSSRFKALNFLTEINTCQTALDWELNILIENAPINLHFSGGRLKEQVLIVGAADRNVTQYLYDDILLINNEETNLLRAAIKENSRPDQVEREFSQYDEISQLNNELVSMQRELAKKNVELAQLNQLKTQFLGMAAHDLRNPLHLIGTYSELLREDPSGLSPQDVSEFLSNIYELSQFMAHLVDDLLSVSVIESGQLRLNLELVNLPALLQRNLARNRLLAAVKQIEITLEIESVPLLVLDAAKIEQILDNLIGNAVKYSAVGAQVQVRLRSEGAEVVLSVEDHGPGIAPDEIDKLFKPFGRARSQSTGGERSTGLGLVIAKRIVEGHHGRIWLESELGKGSTFWIALPLAFEEKV
jgi:signal transduction histidine kinase